jgi:hypothetical protein
VATVFLRYHYLFLTPLIILFIPAQALLNLNILVLFLVALSGLAGNILGKKRASILASVSLLGLLIWGRAAEDLLKITPPDTAFFLVEFGMVVFFMEANIVVLAFDNSYEELRKREDELSNALEVRLKVWLKNQLSRQGKIAIGSIGLSLVLLPLAGFTSISTGQLPLTGALLLLAIIALLFLVTYRREPKEK